MSIDVRAVLDDEELEIRELDRVGTRLGREFAPVDRSRIDALVTEETERLASATVRRFIPVLVERAVRERLRHGA